MIDGDAFLLSSSFENIHCDNVEVSGAYVVDDKYLEGARRDSKK